VVNLIDGAHDTMAVLIESDLDRLLDMELVIFIDRSLDVVIVDDVRVNIV